MRTMMAGRGLLIQVLTLELAPGSCLGLFLYPFPLCTPADAHPRAGNECLLVLFCNWSSKEKNGAKQESWMFKDFLKTF